MIINRFRALMNMALFVSGLLFFVSLTFLILAMDVNDFFVFPAMTMFVISVSTYFLLERNQNLKSGYFYRDELYKYRQRIYTIWYLLGLCLPVYLLVMWLRFDHQTALVQMIFVTIGLSFAYALLMAFALKRLT